jgi:hypothetical protein
VDGFAALVVGLLAVLFAIAIIAQAAFKMRYWRDWPSRWQAAHPAISVLLAMDLFVRAVVRDDAFPRSQRQAALWEAPTFLIGGATLLFGIYFVVASFLP